MVLQGNGKQDTILTFEKGLNVVAGASDTGKSFAYECIDFILGATYIPDIPNEAVGYENILLEIIDKSANQIITLKRSIMESEKSKIYYIYSNIDHLLGADYEVLSSSSIAKNSLSSKLLELCNCTYKNILKKKSNGETESFTFRKFVYLMMINESRIVQKNSPVFIGDTKRDRNSTKEVAAFFTILSGTDYKKYIKTESVEVKKAQLKGGISELSLICDDLRLEISNTEKFILEYNTEDINDRITNLESSIKKQRLVIEKNEEEHEYSINKLNSLVNEKRRILDNLSKFKLLMKNYESDVQRLEFIEQSYDYTGQLADMKCPICNTLMTNEPKDADKEMYYIAIDKEKIKLKSHLTDLQETIDDFESDLLEINEGINQEQNKVKHIEGQLEKQANHISNTLLGYENYLKIRDKTFEIKNNKKKLFDTTIRIEELSERIDKTQSITNKVEIKKLSDELMQEFCSLIQVLLEEWNFISKKKEQQVIFESKSTDVVVCNKTKPSYGKGARAIINSAFIIAIMKYCINRGLPHTGFVILDSPLTTFKEKDRKKNERNEEINKSVKDSFFYYLAKESKDCQIIIFDNEMPPNDLKGITYHYFTGNPEINRTGFIPN